MKIVIAGASGFVGRQLLKVLNTDYEVIGLSRRTRKSVDGVQWVQCDLFSLLDIEKNLMGADVAIYLVHSMLPSASLSQGTFYDFDLIMADNLVRAAMTHKLKHIIYLGGMIPAVSELSWHLRSRLEVEETFRKSPIKTTVINFSYRR